MHLHNVLDSDPTHAGPARIAKPSLHGTARTAFICTVESEPAQTGPLTSARLNGVLCSLNARPSLSYAVN